MDITTPRYTPPEMLQVTGLKPETAQTWINRGIVELTRQNPGRGKRRQYSPLDIVKLSIMRRTDDLNISLSVAREWADGAADKLLKQCEVEWNLYLTYRPTPSDAHIRFFSSPPLLKYSPTVGDPRNRRVSDLVEPSFNRRVKCRLGDPNYSDERPIDPNRREELAREGIHAEPAVIFPLGEIVNGTLLQLQSIDEVSG